MNVLYLMVPLALLLSLGAVAAFVWATKSGQWDDLDLTPKRLLLETNKNKEEHATESNHNTVR